MKYIDDDSDIEQDVADDLKQIGVDDEKDRDFIINEMKRIVKNGCFFLFGFSNFRFWQF